MSEFFEQKKLTGTIVITLSTKKQWYIDKQILCAHIVRIVKKFSNAGYRLTLRQLYYQLVAEDIVVNDLVVYNKLSNVFGICDKIIIIFIWIEKFR